MKKSRKRTTCYVAQVYDQEIEGTNYTLLEYTIKESKKRTTDSLARVYDQEIQETEYMLLSSSIRSRNKTNQL